MRSDITSESTTGACTSSAGNAAAPRPIMAVVGPSGSAADPVPQMQHAVAPDHDVGVLQQVLGVDRAEVPLAGTKHDGHDIHRHLIHEAQGKGLSTDVTGRDRN